MKFTSYWLDTARATPDPSHTEVSEDVDVAVIGGGLTGMSAALHPAHKEARVAVDSGMAPLAMEALSFSHELERV